MFTETLTKQQEMLARESEKRPDQIKKVYLFSKKNLEDLKAKDYANVLSVLTTENASEILNQDQVTKVVKKFDSEKILNCF